MCAAGRSSCGGSVLRGLNVKVPGDLDDLAVDGDDTGIRSDLGMVRAISSPPADLRKLAASGAVPAGPCPLPQSAGTQAVEIERPVSRGGLVSLGPHRLLAAEILGGQLVGIRIDPATATLMFFDPLPGSCCAPAPARSPRTRPPGCAAPAPPDRRPGPRLNRSGPSAAPRLPA